MLQWTTEDVEYICKILTPLFEEEAKNTVELVNTYADGYEKSILLLADKMGELADRVKELTYDNIKWQKFFFEFACRNLNINKNIIEEAYMKWGEEFDKLNKDKFFAKETN